MNRKIIISILVIGLLMTSSIASVNAFDLNGESEEYAGPAIPIADIYVDDDNTMEPWDGTYEHPFQFIQDGVDAAEDGDIVYVFNGTYIDNVEVNKSITLKGQNKDNTIIDGCGYEYVVRLDADGVKITGFTIQNSSDQDAAGIYVSSNSNIITGNIITNIEAEDDAAGIFVSSNSNIITGNIITNIKEDYDADGILLYNSFSNLIKDNRISNIESNYEANGIHISRGSAFNTIQGNIIEEFITSGNCDAIGICIDGWYLLADEPHNNIIKENTIKNIDSNFVRGIWLRYSDNNTVTWNTITNLHGGYSATGIYVSDSSNNTVTSNVIADIRDFGIDLDRWSHGNTVSRNTISGVSHGIFISRHSSNNTIVDNTITNLSGSYAFGIEINYASNNTIIDNTITNINSDGYAFGIEINYASNNTVVSSNTITNLNSDSYAFGITIGRTSNNIVSGNIITNLNSDSYAFGIEISRASNNTIVDNSITNINGNYMTFGISSSWASFNTITGNTIDKAHNGIHLSWSNHTIVEGNNISGSHISIFEPLASGYGVRLYDSYDNLITHNNLIDTARDATFIFIYILDEGEPYEWGEIPPGFESKIESNTWYQNYWNRPLWMPKKIVGILEVWMKHEYWYEPLYTVTLYNYDPDPLKNLYPGSLTIPGSQQSSQSTQQSTSTSATSSSPISR